MEKSEDCSLYPVEIVPAIVVSRLAPQQSRVDEKQSKIQGKREHSDPLCSVGKIVGFCCLIAALAFMLNTVIDSGLRRIKTSEFGVWNKVVEGKINADIV